MFSLVSRAGRDLLAFFQSFDLEIFHIWLIWGETLTLTV